MDSHLPETLSFDERPLLLIRRMMNVFHRLRRRPLTLFVFTAVLLGLIGGLATWRMADAAFLSAKNEIRRDASQFLALQVDALNDLLSKYRVLPPLLAQRADIQALLTSSTHGEENVLARQFGQGVTNMTGAYDIVFYDRNGVAIARTRPVTPTIDMESPFGVAVRYNQLGRKTLIGDEGQTLYAFGSGVRVDGRYVGAIVVYVAMTDLEETWVLYESPIYASDGAGNLLVSNQVSRRYFNETDEEKKAQMLLAVGRLGNGVPISLSGRDYYHASQFMPLMSWEVHVLMDMKPAREAQSATLVQGILFTLLAVVLTNVVLGVLFLQYRRSLLEKATSLRLERQVRDRTKALSDEVEERKAAEQRLREAQANLIQASKLASIGQMSAMLAHEYNQPLAAIRAHSDNAQHFLMRGHADEAGSTLQQINAMVERMAALSKTLRSFARKPRAERRDVDLKDVIDEAITLVSIQARAKKVEIVRGLPDGPLMISAGPIRLSQVVVNLIQNAIDAVGEVSPSASIHEIRLEGFVQDQQVILHVKDTGPGIHPEKLSEVFDPFFTTKDVGEGLGLGLSIAYNIVRDFDGTLIASNRPEGGACFTLNLPALKQKPSKKAKRDKAELQDG